MTFYVSDTPQDGLFFFWADTPTEAECALWAVGLDPETVLCTKPRAWTAYRISAEVFADLVGLGITITDRLGPAEWCARRDGLTDMLKIIERSRLAR